MKECDRIADLFVELHEKRLDAPMEKEAHKHLHNCPGCREDFKWYGITVQALSDLERMQPPDDFLEQLHARLHSPTFSQSILESLRAMFTTFPQLPLPVGVTALTFVVAVAFAVYNYGPTDGFSVGLTKVAQIPGGAATGKAEATMPGRMLVRSYPTSPSSPSEAFSTIPLATSKSIVPFQSGSLPPQAEAVSVVGADNLVLESPSIDNAVESVKRVLPNLRGKLVEEQSSGSVGEAVLQVAIPPNSWPNLTTELINHGAVEVGPVWNQDPSASSSEADRNVLIRIRIVHRP